MRATHPRADEEAQAKAIDRQACAEAERRACDRFDDQPRETSFRSKDPRIVTIEERQAAGESLARKRNREGKPPVGGVAAQITYTPALLQSLQFLRQIYSRREIAAALEDLT